MLKKQEPCLTALEDVIANAKVTQDYMPVWEAIANSDFFVAIHTNDEEKTADFYFDIVKYQEKHYVILAEVIENLKAEESAKAIKLPGFKIVEMLNPEIGIVLNTAVGPLVMPTEIIAWLRKSIQPM